MTGKPDSHPLPPAVRRIAQAFRLYGWISFWLQLVLAVVSAGILLVPAVTQGGETSNPGTSTGLFLAGGGVIALFAGAFWAFRYTRMARRLQYASPDNRPKPKDAMQAIRIGLIIGLVGMLLTLLGAEAIVGSLFVKSLSQLGAGIALDPSRYIQPLDIFVVQAYTHTVVAHFAGIMTALLLFRTVNR